MIGELLSVRVISRVGVVVLVTLALVGLAPSQAKKSGPAAFEVVETTIDQIHAAYRAHRLTARQLTQSYLNRIHAYDQQGPKINAIITLNAHALEDAGKLDEQFAQAGFAGP